MFIRHKILKYFISIKTLLFLLYSKHTIEFVKHGSDRKKYPSKNKIREETITTKIILYKNNLC